MFPERFIKSLCSVSLSNGCYPLVEDKKHGGARNYFQNFIKIALNQNDCTARKK